jgi:hypothetical protein
MTIIRNNSYYEGDKNLTIPEKIEGLPVTVIEENAFLVSSSIPHFSIRLE